jgi:hypothetical protein
MELVLLPRKEFEFKLESGETIEGKYGTWAAKRFSDKRNWPLAKFIEYFSPKVELDKNGKPKKDKQGNVIMKDPEFSMDDICLILLCSVEYQWRKKNKGPFTYSDIDACEWIEEMGGFGSEKQEKLFSHFASDLDATAEKKSQPETVN